MQPVVGLMIQQRIDRILTVRFDPVHRPVQIFGRPALPLPEASTLLIDERDVFLHGFFMKLFKLLALLARVFWRAHADKTPSVQWATSK